MNDIALLWNDLQGVADLGVSGNDLSQDGGLETAVLLSLHVDARADTSDELPDLTTDRRGWWGDLFADVDGDRIGSKLWQLSFLKDVPAIVALAPKIIKDALQWMVTDLVSESVDVTVSAIKNPTSTPNGSQSSWLTMSIAIARPKADPANFLFQYNWDTQELRPANAV